MAKGRFDLTESDDGPGLSGFGRGHPRGLDLKPELPHSTFELPVALDLGDFGGVDLDPLEHLHAKILVRHLAAAEAQGDLHLVALLEEGLDGLHLHLVVVVIDVRAHLDLFDFDDLLLLAGLVGLLLQLVLVASEIDDLDDRRIGLSRDLHQVQADLESRVHRFCGRDHTLVLAILVNQAHARDADVAIDARAVARRALSDR